MKPILYLLVLLLFAHTHAQLKNHLPFGTVSSEEMAMTHCDFDSLADAMVLFDVGESTFIRPQEFFQIRFTRHKRIKILKESGREHAEVHIPFYVSDRNEKEKVKELEAYTYNEVNQSLTRQKLDPATVYEEKINKNWFIKKFVFPNVQVGSILEFKYELITPFIFNLKDWDFQDEIPTKYSEYNVHIIPFYEYVHLPQAIDTFDIQDMQVGTKTYTDYGTKYKHNIYTFALRDVEAFEDESFITSKNDYIKKMDFQLSKIYHPDGKKEERMTTWKRQRKELLENAWFGLYLRKSKSFAKKMLAEELDTTGLTTSQKSQLLIEYVKNSFHWNGRYSKYSSQSPKEFMKSRDGNSADINLLLVALLRAADLEADPMILSTRDHGKINAMYPFISATNYVVAFVKEQSFMADATSKTLHHQLVPPHCINEFGLLINKDKEDTWLTISYSAPSTETTKINMNLEPESLTVNLEIRSYSDYFKAYRKRNAFGDNPDDIKEELSDQFDRVSSVAVTGYNDASDKYMLTYEAKMELEQLGYYLILNPFVNLPISRNPLTQPERSYPVDFTYPYRNKYQVQINLPDGYVPESLPEHFNLTNDLVAIQTSYIHDKDRKKLYVNAYYLFKKAVYQPEEYQELKASIDQLVAVMNRRINLKQTN